MKFDRPSSQQRGLSLVELMIGIAVGLFVVAAATTMVASQLSENRRLLLEVQVHQDLRATTDIIVRDLRRAGAATSTGVATAAVWVPSSGSAKNVMNDVQVGAGGTQVTYSVGRLPGHNDPFGFQLKDGVISSQVSVGDWQALTDPGSLYVDTFSIVRKDEAPIQLVCQKLCATGDQSCWPTITVRSFEVKIAGHSATDPAVSRSVVSRVRLMNDDVEFMASSACPA